MSEMSNPQNAQMDEPTANTAEPQPETVLELDGFTPAEVTRLVATRSRATEGSLNEWTEDYKRLRFARWLYEQGKIDG